MTYEEIIAKSTEFLVDDFEVDGSKITPQASLSETLELDSLDYIDLVVVIESNFGVKVKAEEFGEIVTFKDFYDYINEKLSLKNV